ncbi:aminotransferase class IV family protein [Nocardioides sp. Y6]|uniref:Aminotransferase class IV family protein n=1 Tax=Nocardioides malaquae TaxID=2773426 RepID=A0ABR9RVN5_9ACTN|nr:aminotransferase class IV [Nocardioides malaquae]MBE7325617.1 aminotransferase class IV family protein [Nocardioides malaquae]
MGAVHAGDGLFETLKVVDGVPFALTRHLTRMAASAAELALPEVDVAHLRATVLDRLADLSEAGVLPDVARLRLLWSSRVDGNGALDVTTSGLPVAQGAAHVRTTSWRRNREGAVRGHKSTDYVDNLVALAEAVDQGAGEAIFADTSGMLCEGSGTNIFYVVDGELRTPALSTGCLPGVTRGLVLEWCGGREVEEPLDVLGRASEVFLTSSTREVQPVASCDGWTYAAPGPVAGGVLEVWARRSRETPDP